MLNFLSIFNHFLQHGEMNMRNLLKMLAATCLVALLGVGVAFATPYGENITVSDLIYSGTGWYGNHEDNETEPGTVTTQKWDLEAFLLEGNILSMVGGYDFKNGVDGVTSGDIFIDIDGNALYGPANDGTGYNNTTIVNKTFGYDYVFDLDFASNSYNLYKLEEGVSTTSIYYSINQESNPWKYVSGGELVKGGTFTYLTGLNDSQSGFLGGTHNVATGFDLSFLAEDTDFTAHFTMACGNDNLIGKGTAGSPEPATMLLLGSGLVGIAGLRRKFKKS